MELFAEAKVCLRFGLVLQSKPPSLFLLSVLQRELFHLGLKLLLGEVLVAQRRSQLVAGMLPSDDLLFLAMRSIHRLVLPRVKKPPSQIFE